LEYGEGKWVMLLGNFNRFSQAFLCFSCSTKLDQEVAFVAGLDGGPSMKA
jgi:hypothetical protein